MTITNWVNIIRCIIDGSIFEVGDLVIASQLTTTMLPGDVGRIVSMLQHTRIHPNEEKEVTNVFTIEIIDSILAEEIGTRKVVHNPDTLHLHAEMPAYHGF